MHFVRVLTSAAKNTAKCSDNLSNGSDENVILVTDMLNGEFKHESY